MVSLKRYLQECRNKRLGRRLRQNVAAFEEPLNARAGTRLTSNTWLGRNTHFNGLIIYGKGKVTIGDNFHSGRNCVIRTETHNWRGDKLPYDETYIVEDVTIGDNVWLGEGVTILPGVTIGEGAIIQTGSVVIRDIPALAIAGGHPCIQFSQRPAEHYYALKAAGKFL